MTDTTELLEIVRRADPVPDPAATAEQLDAYRSLLAVIDERSRAMAPQLKTRNRHLAIGEQPAPRRWAWALVAGFAVAIVVVGSVALFLRGAESDIADRQQPATTIANAPTTTTAQPSTPTTTQPASTTTTPAPTTTSPVQTVAVPPMTWQRVGDQPGFQDDLGPIFQAGPGFVAAGPAGIWVSPDARSWELTATGEAFQGDVDIQGDIAVGPSGFVAVGNGRPDDGFFDRGLAWTSPDGLNWAQVPDPENVFVASGFTIIESVTAGGPGFVAVGWDNPGGFDTNAIVWVSEDGASWTRIDDPDLLGRRPRGMAADMVDVIQGGPGLVAVGSTVWLSADGIDWVEVPRDAFEGAEDLLTTRYGRVGFGFGPVTADPVSGALILFRSGPHPEIWRSEDGARWSKLDDPDSSWTGSGDGITAAAWDGQTVLAVGTIEEPGSPAVWASADAGITWARMDTEAFEPTDGHIIELGDVIFDGSQFVVSGEECDRTFSDCRRVLWIGSWD